MHVLLAALLVVALAASAWLVVAARRRSVAWAPTGVAALDVFVGFAAASLGISHLVAVTANALQRSYEWDFRFAALLLVGISIAVPGLACFAAAWRVALGSVFAWRFALAASLLLVVVNAVLLPVQVFFASLLGGLAIANTIALLALGLPRQTDGSPLQP